MITSKTSLRHIALVVPDLRAAEKYYRDLFGMSVVTREAEFGDDLWYALPPDKDWDDAAAAGIELHMAALRNGAFVLALFAGDAPPGQVYVVGLDASFEDIADIRSRLPTNAILLEDQAEALSFQDPYQITWQISSGVPFRSIGDVSGRWLDV